MSLKNIKGEIKFEDKINEDPVLLKTLNTFLKKKRGYVINMPKKGSEVVACISGGMDSVANIVILMEEYKYKVYPFFINRNQSAYKYEKAAILYYNKLFKKKYPKRYNQFVEIKVDTPGQIYKDMLRITKKAMDNTELSRNISYPARNPIMFLTGMEYAYSLSAKNINVRAIFSAHVASDTSYHCSLTWTRLTNVMMCQITNDYNWQFINIPTEQELGNFFDKDIFVKYCNKKDIDLTKTRTCVSKNKIQCGDCPTCWQRRITYKNLGLKDKTKYLYPLRCECPSYYEKRD